MERGFLKSFENGKQAASSFQNSLQGNTPRNIVPSSFQDSVSSDPIGFAAGSVQNPSADTIPISTAASSSQKSLTGRDFT